MTVLDLAKRWAEPPHILLVEDADSVRSLMLRALRRYDCEVHEASSVAAATRWIFLRKFDLVFLDLGLPDGSGVEVIKLLKQEAPATPVLVVTGGLDWEAAHAALREGVVTVLLKPFDIAELKRSLDMFKLRTIPRCEVSFSSTVTATATAG